MPAPPFHRSESDVLHVRTNLADAADVARRSHRALARDVGATRQRSDPPRALPVRACRLVGDRLRRGQGGTVRLGVPARGNTAGVIHPGFDSRFAGVAGLARGERACQATHDHGAGLQQPQGEAARAAGRGSRRAAVRGAGGPAGMCLKISSVILRYSARAVRFEDYHAWLERARCTHMTRCK